ncbi:MAG: nucleotidyltransferase family protein [bacterium]
MEFGRYKHVLEAGCVFAGEEDIPAELYRESKKMRSKTAIRNKIFREIINSIEREKPADLDIIWLKGARVLKTGSMPRGLRRLSDLDLLIRRQQLPEWYELFEQLGFNHHRSLEWLMEDGFSCSVSSTFFTGTWEGQKILLDVHWHLVDFPARRAAGHWDFDIERVWRNRCGDFLSTEDCILYVLDHALSHNYYQWKFILDLHYLLNSETIDYDRVKTRAQKLNFSDSFQTGRQFLDYALGTRGSMLIPGSNPGTSPRYRSYFKRAIQGNTRKGEYLIWCLDHLNSAIKKITFLYWIVMPPVEAIPGVQNKPGIQSKVLIYGDRLKRVIKEGWKMFTRRWD